MSGKNKKSIEEEAALKEKLRELYLSQNLSYSKVANRLAMKPRIVRYYLHKFDLKKSPILKGSWAKKEEEFLAKFYGNLPIELIANSLSRSVSACLNRVFKLHHSSEVFVSHKASEDSFKLHSDLLKAKWKDPIYRKKMTKMAKDMWKNPEYRYKQSQRINLLKIGDPDFLKRFYAGRLNKPNRPEKALAELLRRNFPNEFAYNGDFSQGVMLANLIPDFVNVNGRKLVIELYGDFWHNKDHTKHRWKATEFGRIARYSQVGFKCVIIWEHELSEPNSVIQKIKEAI